MRRLCCLLFSYILIPSGVAEGKKRNCPYDVIIGGITIRGDGTECFESPEQGVLAEVTGIEVDAILVWDPDAPCGNGRSYVHYAAEGTVQDFEPMTAGAGDVIHTYESAMFPQGLPLDEGTAGCATVNAEGEECVKSWKVARHGTSCPEAEEATSGGMSIIRWLMGGLLVGLLFWKRQDVSRYCFAVLGRNKKLQSYIALSTFAGQ